MRCHAGDINQVVLNIVVNAAHAIHDRVEGTDERGVIRVRTFEQGRSRRRDDLRPVAASRPRSRTGSSTRSFTTKALGRGTGQGLAISRTVVDKHQGSLTFDTTPGVGTTFTIRLPMEGTEP